MEAEEDLRDVQVQLNLVLCPNSIVGGREEDDGNENDDIKLDPSLRFENPRLREAYVALQTWKQTISSDPFDFTGSWVGPNVCSYNGIFCAPLPSDKKTRVIAGIDPNHADMAGYWSTALVHLTDLALFHLNSNRFYGDVPITFNRMKLLYELDLSNNNFVGKFPKVVLSLPPLKFLDLRYNGFEGKIPANLFDKGLDGIFLNDNNFMFGILNNIGNSPISVLVLANNDLGGCIPASIGLMGKTLTEIVLLNDNLIGCLPPQIGNMTSLEQLNAGNNVFTCGIPRTVCKLSNIKNFTYSFNYFTCDVPRCTAFSGDNVVMNGTGNCILGKPLQRPPQEFSTLDGQPVDCDQWRIQKKMLVGAIDKRSAIRFGFV
ncbi:PREDICTED: leucine-rich repeat extensin-like protein 2 [Tarenaya hassleriana]|uniref:leucine-rich repeat extensin-like protein 2 n=1 Tax=Tarenaya hassleriana TaxID=28532 RepID=UPI00053C572D|nr:PREDICTED: leucine-rich repeat extensin-like protein 2 [Tarenaya hassleriana]